MTVTGARTFPNTGRGSNGTGTKQIEPSRTIVVRNAFFIRVFSRVPSCGASGGQPRVSLAETAAPRNRPGSGYRGRIRARDIRARLVAWLRSRRWRRFLKLPRWWPWTLLLLVPILLINLAVAWVGRSAVFPLSPFYLKYKLEALGNYAWHRPRCVFSDDAPIEPLLARAEQRHHLPCGLLGAIVKVESGGKPHRISPAGAMGPMQLIPPTARGLGVSDPFDPEESLDGAARYLQKQMATFHSIRLAAAAYNAGPGAVVGHAIPHNGQTEIYVARVMTALQAERRARCAPPARPSPPRQSAPPLRSPPAKRTKEKELKGGVP